VGQRYTFGMILLALTLLCGALLAGRKLMRDAAPPATSFPADAIPLREPAPPRGVPTLLQAPYAERVAAETWSSPALTRRWQASAELGDLPPGEATSPAWPATGLHRASPLDFSSDDRGARDRLADEFPLIPLEELELPADDARSRDPR